jgi:hypothetical protein
MDALLEDAAIVFSSADKETTLDDNKIVACFVLYQMLLNLRVQATFKTQHFVKLIALIDR